MNDFPNEIELFQLNKEAMTVKIMGWKPPQRPQWLKEIMRTPGPIRVQLLLLLILTTSSVLSTGLQIFRQGKNTSGVNTSTPNVNLEVVRDGLRLRVIGKDTMEALTNLSQIENYLETRDSKEKSSASTKPSGR